MGIKRCMNDLCGTTSSAEWKTGWALRSGDLAILCRNCGYAFEQNSFCEQLHKDDSGWRSCGTCGKRLHCGCIASLSLIVLLDGCGVKCIGCARNPEPYSSRNGGKCENYRLFTGRENNVGVDNHKDSNRNIQLPTPHNLNTNVSVGLPKQEGVTFPTTEVEPTLLPPTISIDNAETYGAWRPEATWASTLAQIPMGSFLKDKHDVPGNNMQTTDNYESVAHPNLNMSLGISSGNLQFSSVIVEREQRKMSDAFNQAFASPCLVPTPPKVSFSPAADTNTSMMPQLRLARPPVEGRGRHQLLPRYWPRITDQELQQISGDSNCTIIPLFEKVLSASDAGRIGRLVLPKACAEAYFPPISQAEGLPINILDVKGKEWVFQFRFWPNNNSRMYVLEGVTPCIQSMQLQAGDTVTFSRKDPEGKLVMGFRKASNSPLQNQPVSNGYPGLSVPMKGNTDTHMHALSKQLDSAGRSVNLHNGEKCGEPTKEGLLPSSTMMTERKKGRNIGAKSKRLLMENQDAQALRLTWTEVQGLLRPPSNVNPSIVVIEDAEFEEYEEPPVFGKSSVFATRSPGVIEQWAQCDSCSKWRRLPADFLLPTKWTCMDNAWDPTRCFCSAPDELSPKELEFLFSLNKDSTKKRMTLANKAIQEQDSSGASALAIAAGSSDNPNEPGTSAVATTTKHPRHRPGCSCIVCIQPPSGKGKHDSTCTCTVCMTVKRRFKTLMMRKKKRQSDQEAEMVLKNSQILNASKEDCKISNNGDDQNTSAELADCGPSLDLNFHPEREEELRTGASQASLTNLLELTSAPLDSYVKQNPDEQASSAANPGEDAGETERDRVEERPASQDQSSKPENTSNKQSDTQ